MQQSKQQRTLKALQTFIDTPLTTKLQQSVNTDAQRLVLELFHSVANHVPAYRQFLQEQGVDPHFIQTFADFQSIPLTTKSNYLQRYPLPSLCREGQLEACDWIAVSSGSTGTPSFWSRFITDEFQIATRFEQIFRESFRADTKTTLAVICFALGTWIGGMYTASCCRHLATKGYPLTIITPGNNKTEILRVVQELAPFFEQVVLLGYPPFLKDVIDTGISQGMNWGDYGVKLVMAGEVFSEEWRTLVGKRMGSSSPYYDWASLYGTADAGVLGNETPLTICIRRFLADRPDAARKLFGESRLPTLVQYDPTSRFFETQDGTLLFSGDNGIPLIRYHISDTGGIIPYQEMLQFLQEWEFAPITKLQSGEGRGIYPLPFVYVFGRSHFTVSYFGANIYPENVTVGLEQLEIQDWVTGKFVMEVKEDTDKNIFLSIVVELSPGVQASESKQQAIADSIRVQLLRLNSEFANYVPPDLQLPKITLLPPGDQDYFPIGVKHRYTRNLPFK
jgi:phenylacetate-CoA ligase